MPKYCWVGKVREVQGDVTIRRDFTEKDEANGELADERARKKGCDFYQQLTKDYKGAVLETSLWKRISYP